MLSILLHLFLFLPLQGGFTIDRTHDFIKVDHLGNVYVVDDSELLMFDKDGMKLANFSNSMLGEISDVDVSDPLRILVFYKEFNQLLFLDRNLAEIGEEIDLYDYSDNESELACSSSNSGFWTYNSIDNQAIHFSEYGKRRQESILLNSFFEDAIPSKMIENSRNLYLLYPNNGILALDQNGRFLKKISFTKISDVQFVSNSIVYTNQDGLYSHQPFEKEDKLLYSSNNSKEEQILVRNNKIYISNKKSISIKTLTY